MRFDLYRPTDQEQADWLASRAELDQRATLDAQVTPEIAQRIQQIHASYPWLEAGVIVPLARAGVPDEAVADAAAMAADQKGARG